MVHVNVELLFQLFTGHNFALNSTYPIGRSYKKMKTHNNYQIFTSPASKITCHSDRKGGIFMLSKHHIRMQRAPT